MISHVQSQRPGVSSFNEDETIHRLRHFLPSQAPLKDFIHHNPLHAFQEFPFDRAVHRASKLFGFRTRLPLEEYRQLYHHGKISLTILNKVVEGYPEDFQGIDAMQSLLNDSFNESLKPRIGQLRSQWKSAVKVNLDKAVHPMLFRLIASYLDQGISIWQLPASYQGLLSAIRYMEVHSLRGLFKSDRVRKWLMNKELTIVQLLELVVGKSDFYERYLFDQQMAHPGWSGMVAVIEERPETLLDSRIVSLREFIQLELLLEIDFLDTKFGTFWKPLGQVAIPPAEHLWDEVKPDQLETILSIWHKAYEWSYYDQVIGGIQNRRLKETTNQAGTTFQSLFCIDDRECSLRRYLEVHDPGCVTFGTPGFFNVDCYFQPEHGQFMTKICPAPIAPKHVIKEKQAALSHTRDSVASDHTHGVLSGWLISQTLGMWAGLRLLFHLFRPSRSPLMVSSSGHMDKNGILEIENTHAGHNHDGLQVGYTISEMTDRVGSLLGSIGLVREFAAFIYVVGHGASSVNNTYYAGYDCGACSGRPGSVNARAFSWMANHTAVRKALRERGIEIPDETLFVGALHDTTRDEVEFFDEDLLGPELLNAHQKNVNTFTLALDDNSKERSRRFLHTDTKEKPASVHKKVRLRSVSLFEPRPELNHATNALCIVGKRELTNHLFLDRRSFLNSYDYRLDPDGNYLLGILRAATPVCGGINLEYFFSRTDNYRLGAGTKLPHNVVGLIGLANGADGDLRPGLPSQMIEVHSPMRLLMIVEQSPDALLNVILRIPEVYEWYAHEWIHLVAIHPETREAFVFKMGEFVRYQSCQTEMPRLNNPLELAELEEGDLPVYRLA